MHGRRRSRDERRVDALIEGVDITRQPCNRIYYEHILGPDDEANTGEATIYNDFHVRNQLLAQYKYGTEKSKTITFFVITVLSYVIIFPVFVMHFTRTYRNLNNSSVGSSVSSDAATTTFNYDNTDAMGRGVYTAFVWISYTLLVIKSLLCLCQNRFYRNAMYQAANCRGFSGVHDFQREIKSIVRKIDEAI